MLFGTFLAKRCPDPEILLAWNAGVNELWRVCVTALLYHLLCSETDHYMCIGRKKSHMNPRKTDPKALELIFRKVVVFSCLHPNSVTALTPHRDHVQFHW